jgi:ribonuclease BN (tRNA processing enzyme)
VATQAEVKALILYHLSIRYDRATAIPALRAQVAASGFGGECWLLDESDLVPLR